MIIAPYIRGSRENGYNSLALVGCEHLEHQGDRNRLIRKREAEKGYGVKFCRMCCLKGKKCSQVQFADFLIFAGKNENSYCWA